jgi:RNA polymerase sigma factor (sigma-70 family)
VATHPPGRFATTRWSIVRAAADGPAEDAGRDALAVLYETYWRPVYAYCRRRGLAPDDAEDVSQEFYSRLLSSRDLEAANPEKGRFRAYLLTCLKHFLSNDRRDAGAEKRGGGRPLLSLDADEAESWQADMQSTATPEQLFERAWALTLLERALGRVREDYEDTGRGDVFAVLKPVLTSGSQVAPYRDLATQLDTSVGAVKVAVHKLRQRFREVLRLEIAETVTSPDEVEAEIRDLFAALG